MGFRSLRARGTTASGVISRSTKSVVDLLEQRVLFSVPANNDFANAISFTTASVTGSNVMADMETGEQSLDEGAGSTVWYKVVPSKTSTYEIDLTPKTSGFFPVGAIYTGSDVADLTLVQTLYTGPNYTIGQSQRTYYIVVDGNQNRGTRTTGSFVLSAVAKDAPKNDNFAQPSPLNSLASGTLVAGTIENGEASVVGHGLQSTAWWTWKAPSTGVFRVTAHSTSSSSYGYVSDPTVEAYVGDSLDALTLKAKSIDSGGGEGLWLEATRGTTYRIMVGAGSSAEMGSYQLRAAIDSGAPAQVHGFRAQADSGTPVITWEPAARATSYGIWRSTTPSRADGGRIATVDGAQASFVDPDRQVGQVYYYWVVAYNQKYGNSPFSAGFACPLFVPQDGNGITANDTLQNAYVISGNNVSVVGDNTTATADVDEPIHSNVATDARKTVWFKWTPASTANVNFDLSQSDFSAIVALYTASSDTPGYGDLTPVDSSYWYNSFDVTVGTTYWIAVDGNTAYGDEGSSGTYRLQISGFTQDFDGSSCAADDFASATVLSGPSVKLSGDTYDLTTETNEAKPNRAVTSTGWWAWTADVDGTVTLFRDELYAPESRMYWTVYSGNALSALTKVAGNSGVADSIQFAATNGITYYIQVGAMSDQEYDWTWALEQQPIPSVTLPNATLSVDENSTASTIIGSVAATGGNDAWVRSYAIIGGNAGNTFAIDPVTGQISVASGKLLDYEKHPQAFALKVALNVLGQARPAATATVTINVNDVNEAPVFTVVPLRIAENAKPGTVLTTFRSADPEKQAVTYSIAGGNDLGGFVINSNNQLVVADSTALDFETTPVFNLTIRASDPDNNGTDAVVTIHLTNANEAPTDITLTPADVPVTVGSPSHTAVGTLSGTDPDAGSVLAYRLVTGEGSTNNGLFEIVGAALRTKSAVSAAGMYSVRVRVADKAGRYFEKILSVTVAAPDTAQSSLMVGGAGADEVLAVALLGVDAGEDLVRS